MSLVSSTSNTWWFYRLQIICDLSNVWTKQKQLILNMKPDHEMFLKLYQLFSRNIKTFNSTNIEIYINWHKIRQKQLESDNDVDWLFHRSHNNFICYQDVKNIWILSGKYLSGVCRMIAGARLTGLPRPQAVVGPVSRVQSPPTCCLAPHVATQHTCLRSGHVAQV